jgi:Uma2 family endonuclease
MDKLIKKGQRWRYTDSNYNFIIEVISPPDNSIIVQTVKIHPGGYMYYQVGSQYTSTIRDGGETWKYEYLEGQDNYDT